MEDYSNWVLLGGGLHLAILIASGLVPQVLDWRTELRKLPPLFGQLVWVHGAFVALTIVGFGIVSLVNYRELCSGTMLARSVCALISIFWGIRLTLQWGYFTPAPYLQSLILRIGYHLLTVVFVSLTVIYGWAAIRPIPEEGSGSRQVRPGDNYSFSSVSTVLSSSRISNGL